jgi:hypothetical protein
MEQDKPKNLLILGYTLAICSVLVGTVIFVNEYLKADVRHEYEKKILTAPNVEFKKLQDREKDTLSKYSFVDKAKGVVRLPKERARELVLKEWAARPEGVVQPATAAGAAPAPAPEQPIPPPPTPGNPNAPQGAQPASPAGTPTAPGAATGASSAHEPPSTAQPQPLAPGETPAKHPTDKNPLK